MRQRWRAILPIVALFAVLYAIIASCGDESDLTVEEYFRKVEIVAIDADSRFIAANELLREDSSAKAYIEYLDAAIAAHSDALEALERISPPEAVKTDHIRFRAVIAGRRDSLLGSQASILDTDPSSSIVVHLHERGNCEGLREIAANHSIDAICDQ
jgi:hypothetical protein